MFLCSFPTATVLVPLKTKGSIETHPVGGTITLRFLNRSEIISTSQHRWERCSVMESLLPQGKMLRANSKLKEKQTVKLTG
jgi:hypothetical protein